MDQFLTEWQNLPPKQKVLDALKALGPDLDRELNIIYHSVKMRFYWVPIKIEGGPDPEDLAQNAIMAVICGQRNWNIEEMCFSTAVIGTVRSWVFNLRRKHIMRKKEQERAGNPKRGGKTAVGYEHANDIYGNEFNPEDTYTTDEILGKIKEIIHDDNVLYSYAKYKLEMPSRTVSDIAKFMKVNPKTIYYAVQRLRNYLKNHEEFKYYFKS